MAISSGVGPHRAWVSVNGLTLPVIKGNVHIHGTKKASTFEATVALYQTPGLEAALANIGDNQASVVASTLGVEGTLVTGEIDDIDIDYIGGAAELCGRDNSAKLHEKLSAEKWINKHPDEIIQDLAGRVGLSVQIDPLAIKMARLMNSDHVKLSDTVTYATLVHKLSEFMGAHWYCQGNTLKVVSGNPQGAPYTINISIGANNEVVSDALSLKIKRNVQAGKPIDVKVKAWHVQDKKVYTGQYTVGGNGTQKEYTYHLPNLKQDHVDQHAKAKAKDHSRHELTISAEVAGDPTIDASGPLILNGTAFAGSYTMDEVEHEIGMDGHTTSITAKGPKAGRS